MLKSKADTKIKELKEKFKSQEGGNTGAGRNIQRLQEKGMNDSEYWLTLTSRRDEQNKGVRCLVQRDHGRHEK